MVPSTAKVTDLITYQQIRGTFCNFDLEASRVCILLMIKLKSEGARCQSLMHNRGFDSADRLAQERQICLVYLYRYCFPQSKAFEPRMSVWYA